MSFLPELYIWYNFVFWDNPLHVPHRKYSSACNIYNLLFTRLGELQGYFVIDMQDKSFQHYNIIKLIQIMKIKLLPGPYLSRFICSKWRNTHTSLCFGKSALNPHWISVDNKDQLASQADSKIRIVDRISFHTTVLYI